MYELATTAHFERRLARFLERHRDLSGRLGRVLADLAAEPFQPRLQTHPLRGQLAGFHGVSLSHQYRLVARIDSDEQRVELRDIGTHDEVYR